MLTHLETGKQSRAREQRIRPPRGRAKVLCNLVMQNGWTIGAELGVLRGETLLHLVSRCPHLTMVGVDTWTVAEGADSAWEDGGRSYTGHDLEGYHGRLQRLLGPFSSRTALLRMPTQQAELEFDDGHFDFVFIDADHRYEAVKADIEAWWPKIRVGGMLLGHDWGDRAFPGVERAVRERFGEPDIIGADKVWGVWR